MNVSLSRQRFLAASFVALLCGVFFQADAQAVERFRFPAYKLKNEPLKMEHSWDSHSLRPYRAMRVSPFATHRNDPPVRYVRPSYNGWRQSR